MKIYITRYSNPSKKIQPCEEAQLDKNNRWYVELHSLAGLIDLAEKYDTLILVVDHAKKEYRIEIFDDWSSEA